VKRKETFGGKGDFLKETTRERRERLLGERPHIYKGRGEQTLARREGVLEEGGEKGRQCSIRAGPGRKQVSGKGGRWAGWKSSVRSREMAERKRKNALTIRERVDRLTGNGKKPRKEFCARSDNAKQGRNEIGSRYGGDSKQIWERREETGGHGA